MRYTPPPTMPKKVLRKGQAEEVDDLYKLRHSLAHVLAQAMLRLYPKTKLSIGPPIDYGCYYDFLFAEPISDADFPLIEKEMRRIIQEGQVFSVETLSIKDAIAFWKKKKQPFKVELIEDLRKKEGAREVTHYSNLNAKGEETFIDLCKGGHVENLREIPADAFRIVSLAGAYFRGDEKREQLTRIYVAAFRRKEELKAYLQRIEEAKQRDHRKIGKELDLFVFSDLVGPGLPLFLPKGEVLKDTLERYIRAEKESIGYTFVCIPHIAKKELYIKSGHWGKYDATMPAMKDREGNEFIVKPMNCPHHFELYNCRPHSYREFPIRYAETTACYRNEKSGELAGLTRVKGLTQDDTHHFVRSDQIESEIAMILGLMERVFRLFGFNDMHVTVSVRDPKEGEKYFGGDALWDKSERILMSAVKAWGVTYDVDVGEAAFYGPKIDIIVNDAIGRGWQLTTVQLDFNQPENFDLSYTGEDGKRHRPAVLHVTILGSLERFMGILIEHFAGLFPLWLAPVQVGLLPVTEAQEGYARDTEARLRTHGIRTTFFDASTHLGKRIHEGEKQRIPYLLVLGKEEAGKASVNVRNVKTKAQALMPLEEFLAKTLEDICERKLEPSIG